MDQFVGLPIQAVPIDSLVFNPRNPRSHPQRQIEMLAASLERFGQPRAVLARLANRMIIGGHGICLAAAYLKWPTVQCQFWDVSQAVADAYMLTDNRMGELAIDNAAQVAELLREQPKDRLASVGYTEAEVDALIKQLEGDVLTLQELVLDPSDVADKFWISLRGPLKDQAHILAVLSKAVKDKPDVHIVQGTTRSLS